MTRVPGDLQRRIEDELDRLAPAFEALCGDLHRQPELGCREVNTEDVLHLHMVFTEMPD